MRLVQDEATLLYQKESYKTKDVILKARRRERLLVSVQCI